MEALGVDYVDLALVHWPHPGHEETYRGLEALVDEGLVKAVGLSNYTVEDYRKLESTLRIAPVVNQIEVNPLLFRKDCVEFFQQAGLVVQAYKPLRRGAALNAEEITAIAAKHGISNAQVCLRWAIQRNMVVLPKTATPARMVENLDIFGCELDDADMRVLDSLTKDETLEDWASHLEDRKNQDLGAYVTRPKP
mmetsp:Transcript_8896/g.33594  ORF Transcript_8896/g.33594 Transcript_8896/m.33594 type:complete len:194 (-) Transcript_8896:42-623(-)